MIRRTVLEWRRIAYGDGEEEIPDWAGDRIAAFAKQSSLGGDGGARILTHGRKDLRAGQVVGVLAVEGCALEILPKIDGLGDGRTAESRGRIREQLVHMVAEVLDLEIDIGRITQLGWQRESLLEILIELFAVKLADAVRQGMPRRYIDHQDDLPALRGRLDVTRQFTTLAASPQKLACRYDTLSADIPLNQIMTAAVAHVSRISRSPKNQRRLRELAFAYADIALAPAQALRFDKVILDRTNVRWRQLLGLAQLLLGDRFQTTSAGLVDGYALLFEMNTLFEKYVAKMLTRALHDTNLKVVSQGGRLHCLQEIAASGSGPARFQTKPDILIKRGIQTVLVVDTKWKRLASRIDDPKQGVAQADVYQMMAYGRLYRCPRLMLLYPHHEGLGIDEGVSQRHRISGSEDELVTATVDVAVRQAMTTRLAGLITNSIM